MGCENSQVDTYPTLCMVPGPVWQLCSKEHQSACRTGKNDGFVDDVKLLRTIRRKSCSWFFLGGRDPATPPSPNLLHRGYSNGKFRVLALASTLFCFCLVCVVSTLLIPHCLCTEHP